jgi:hypothetical protein
MWLIIFFGILVIIVIVRNFNKSEFGKKFNRVIFALYVVAIGIFVILLCGYTIIKKYDETMKYQLIGGIILGCCAITLGIIDLIRFKNKKKSILSKN